MHHRPYHTMGNKNMTLRMFAPLNTCSVWCSWGGTTQTEFNSVEETNDEHWQQGWRAAAAPQVRVDPGPRGLPGDPGGQALLEGVGDACPVGCVSRRLDHAGQLPDDAQPPDGVETARRTDRPDRQALRNWEGDPAHDLRWSLDPVHLLPGGTPSDHGKLRRTASADPVPV